MSKTSRFRETFDKQHRKRAQTLLKSSSHQLYDIHWSLPSQLSWKKSLLLTCQILGLLVNTLAADEKYPLLNRDNWALPIHMQLSQKQKKFPDFFSVFSISRLNFKYFEKKDDPQRFCIFQVTDSENVVRWMSKNSPLREPFDKQHGKRAQALFKSASYHPYHIHWYC